MGPISSVKRHFKLASQGQVEMPGMLVEGIGLPTKNFWQYRLFYQFSAFVVWLASDPFSNTLLAQHSRTGTSHGFSDFKQLIINNDSQNTSFTAALKNIVRLSYTFPHQTTTFPGSGVLVHLVDNILQHHIPDCRSWPQVGVTVLTFTPGTLRILPTRKEVLLFLICLFITSQPVGTLKIGKEIESGWYLLLKQRLPTTLRRHLIQLNQFRKPAMPTGIRSLHYPLGALVKSCAIGFQEIDAGSRPLDLGPGHSHVAGVGDTCTVVSYWHPDFFQGYRGGRPSIRSQALLTFCPVIAQWNVPEKELPIIALRYLYLTPQPVIPKQVKITRPCRYNLLCRHACHRLLSLYQR